MKRQIRSPPHPPRLRWPCRSSRADAERAPGVVRAATSGPSCPWPDGSGLKKNIYSSRIDGTTFISNTFARLRCRPHLLISASATDYYAESHAPVDEAHGCPGEGFMAEMCRDWEAATEPASRAGIRVVQMRIPPVLASRGHSLLAAVLPLFKRGLGPVLGSGEQLMCFIALDDMVRAIEYIIDHEEVGGPVNVLAPKPVTNAEFARALSKVLRRPVFLKAPGWLLRLTMGEVADAFLAGDANLRPTKLTEAGFQFLYPDITSALRHELAIS